MVIPILLTLVFYWALCIFVGILVGNLSGLKRERTKWHTRGVQDGLWFGRPLMLEDDFGGGWQLGIWRRKVNRAYQAGVTQGLLQRSQR